MTANALRRVGDPGAFKTIADNAALRQLASFGAIGVVSTAAYVAIFAAVRTVAPAPAANVVALVLTALGNTAANRRLTFGVQGRSGLARDHAAGLLSLAVALALTSAALGVLDLLAPHRGCLTEIAVLVAANAAATVVRFVLLRVAIDGGRTCPAPMTLAAGTLPESKRNRG